MFGSCDWPWLSKAWTTRASGNNTRVPRKSPLGRPPIVVVLLIIAVAVLVPPRDVFGQTAANTLLVSSYDEIENNGRSDDNSNNQEQQPAEQQQQQQQQAEVGEKKKPPPLRPPQPNKMVDGGAVSKDAIEESLQTIYDIATDNLGSLCLANGFRSLRIPLSADRYEAARQKADLASMVLQDVGVNRHGGLLDALAKGLLSDSNVIAARVLAMNISNGALTTSVWWSKQIGAIGGPYRVEDEDGVSINSKPDTNYPWFEDELSTPVLRSPKFSPSPPNASFRGWWTYPYYSCNKSRWLLSYSVAIPPTSRHGVRGFLSIDVDVSELQVNQCDRSRKFNPVPAATTTARSNAGKSRFETIFEKNSVILVNTEDNAKEIEAFLGSHKCHAETMNCDNRNYPFINNKLFMHAGGGMGSGRVMPGLSTTSYASSANSMWVRGFYQCSCKPGYYSMRHPHGYNGTLMEVSYLEQLNNVSQIYTSTFVCHKCATGCDSCDSPAPCLATYNWPFRIALLTISVLCAAFTIGLAFYMFAHRKVKVFKVASPIFLTITLLGCATMFMEMAAIFPILDQYSCIATKWTRHMGFCVTYTALLMKTWRVSLTYRVKSAHKVKLTDQQLLQWMVPILLVMLIYLGTWTLSATPYAEVIRDSKELKFKQCSYNWWDHSLAIGEVLFLAWGIRVCYNVRNAESLYNEARLISYAIYNIAVVNTAMVAFHLLIFPQAGPDIKYLLGFIRTQLSTSVTVALVFGPKVVRVLRGQGDQWDNRSRVRGISASFSLNGIGLVPEESPDLYQENEELKEEIQKLAAQIEFMRIVNMEMNNRHLKPKPGGYFNVTANNLQSPMFKGSISFKQSQWFHNHHNNNNNNSIAPPTNQQQQQAATVHGPGNATVPPTTVTTPSSPSPPPPAQLLKETARNVHPFNSAQPPTESSTSSPPLACNVVQPPPPPPTPVSTISHTSHGSAATTGAGNPSSPSSSMSPLPSSPAIRTTTNLPPTAGINGGNNNNNIHKVATADYATNSRNV